jgi:ABC-type molybdate transport system substrate-binding protein
LELNIVATYSIAPLTESDEFDLAQAFIAYVLSNNGQAILQKWGFAPP